tara:strand:+ start:3516 stop:4481 length:966 start_codon:yes stop_codon:yes gene_type:complete
MGTLNVGTVNATNANVTNTGTIEVANLTNGRLDLPVWTTATRPSSPVVGSQGYNSSEDMKKIEYWTGAEWLGVGETSYLDGVTNGLVLWLDPNRQNGYSGNVVTDHSSTIGDVNIRNRSNDWSITTESSTSLVCIYNGSNRTSVPGINIPMNNGWNKQTATIDMWIRPTGDHTGGHGWFNNSDGDSYTNNSNWFWWGSWNTSNNHYARWGNSSTCCNDLSFSGFQSTYPLNTWFHWCLAWNTTQGRATLFKNGVQINSKTNIPTNVTSSNPTNTGQLFNGHDRSDNMQFKGWCSQYRIYNRELSAGEILTNYDTYKAAHNL